jgi:general stress protein YciG
MSETSIAGKEFGVMPARWRDSERDDRRGFAAMDPEEHREISRRGGYSSQGGRGREFDEWSDREGARRGFDDEYGDRGGGSRRGFGSMDPEERREIARMGGRPSHGGRGRDSYDDGRERDDDWGGRSRRGFAAMDPEEQREIARMGGRASHGGRGREEDDDRRFRSRSDDEDDRRFRSREDDDDRRFRSRGGNGEDDDRSSRSRRGFAAMDPEEQREIARMGGRASHGGRSRDIDDDDDDRRSSRYRGRDDDERSGSRSRRGFAAMDPQERREIARMGGRASHEYGRGHEFTSEEAREAGRKGGYARWH